MWLELTVTFILYAFVTICLLIVKSCFLSDSFAGVGGKSALLVIAHPDDECMFFGPTLNALKASKYEVHLLCCCTGNFYGQGRVREEELIKSVSCLGIKSQRVSIIDHENLPDNPDVTWPPEVLRELIMKQCAAIENLEILVTFDNHGVSGHANHIAVSKAVEEINECSSHLSCYKLLSSSIFIKYLGAYIPFGLPLVLVLNLFRRNKVIVSGWCGIMQTQYAMFQHKSQLLWFRYLFIIFSQYMTVNELELM